MRKKKKNLSTRIFFFWLANTKEQTSSWKVICISWKTNEGLTGLPNRQLFCRNAALERRTTREHIQTRRPLQLRIFSLWHSISLSVMILLLLLLFQIKIYNFWKGWTFGYKFLTASSQTSIEIAKKKNKKNNKALWKGDPVTRQDLRGTSVDRMPAIPVKRRPTRTLLPKKADSGQVLSLNSSYINYFRRSKAEY